jgi:hypothetical protein
LSADIDTIGQGHFLRQPVRRLTGMAAVGPRTVYLPGQAGTADFITEYSFRQRASADIAQANHQDFHGRKDTGKNEKSVSLLWIYHRPASQR